MKTKREPSKGSLIFTIIAGLTIGAYFIFWPEPINIYVIKLTGLIYILKAWINSDTLRDRIKEEREPMKGI